MEQLRVQQPEWISASIVTMLNLWDGARNLRAESDIKYDLANNCHAFICVDLLAKKTVQRGQRSFPRRASASQTALEDQILNETRLQNLQLQLLKDMWICARLTWSIA
ncbi:hypothetical protein MA16_Dca028183 [Dendrobium catenatum]|uniref:Uncharacterized protein n=1 Tax=Dendrobium catenatum TaxID=906689 RepID=A0A2I0VFC3_9ASPA|nr:hypothetical protein MA16_Dca028183 [Dendrobium catenatum]